MLLEGIQDNKLKTKMQVILNKLARLACIFSFKVQGGKEYLSRRYCLIEPSRKASGE